MSGTALKSGEDDDSDALLGGGCISDGSSQLLRPRFIAPVAAASASTTAAASYGDRDASLRARQSHPLIRIRAGSSELRQPRLEGASGQEYNTRYASLRLMVEETSRDFARLGFKLEINAPPSLLLVADEACAS